MLRFACIALLLLAGGASAQALQPWSGGPPPALQLKDLDGAIHRLQDYRGQVVLLNFWATWCGPCRAEMPSIERLRESMAGRPFAVLAVNVGESERLAREFAHKLPVSFTILLDRDTTVARAWGARILPATYVIGPDGRIRYRYFGELNWSSAAVRTRIEALMERPGTQAAR